MDDMKKFVLVEPGKPAYVVECEDTLENLKELVNGSIDIFYPFDDGTVFICNDEGKYNGMERNRPLYDEKTRKVYDIVYGPFVIAWSYDENGEMSENFESLPEEMIKKYLEKYSKKEALFTDGTYLYVLK